MKPPYTIITAVCRNDRCRNHGQEFSKQKRLATYQSTAGTTEAITSLVCPSCRAWGRVVKTEEVL